MLLLVKSPVAAVEFNYTHIHTYQSVVRNTAPLIRITCYGSQSFFINAVHSVFFLF
jgi:hypothetical protein